MISTLFVASITSLFVYIVLTQQDFERWKYFRRNIVSILYDHMFEITVILNKSVLQISHDNEDYAVARGSSDQRPQYRQDPGIILRSLEPQVQQHHRDIRKSIELGFIGASSRHAAALSDIQLVIDDLAFCLSMAVRTKTESAYTRVDGQALQQWNVSYERLFDQTPHDGIADDTPRAPFASIAQNLNTLSRRYLGGEGDGSLSSDSEGIGMRFRIVQLARSIWPLKPARSGAVPTSALSVHKSAFVAAYPQVDEFLRSLLKPMAGKENTHSSETSVPDETATN